MTAVLNFSNYIQVGTTQEQDQRNRAQNLVELSYDIIKVHGGEIKMETKEGEGAHFIVELP